MYRQSTRKRKLTKEQKIKMFYQFNSFHQNTKPQKLKVISSLNLRLITPLLTPSNHSDFFFNTYRRIQEHKSVSNHHDS